MNNGLVVPDEILVEAVELLVSSSSSLGIETESLDSEEDQEI